MKIIFMGTPNFAIPSLEALNKKYDVIAIVSQPNRNKKKGILLDTPVAKYAKDNNIKLYQPEQIKDIIDELLSLEADTLVTAAYGQYLPTKLLNGFKIKVNVHGSLLPKHRGGAPIQRAILNGDEVTGVTIVEMAKKLDGGKVYAKSSYTIKPIDNSTTLFNTLSIIGADLLINSIEDIYNGKNLGTPQDDTLATYSANLKAEEEKINIHDTTKNILNRIHAFAMDIGAYLLINDIKLKIFEAHEVNGLIGDEGSVLDIKKQIILKTKDSAISLDLVQLPGKKVISGKDFSNGQKIFVVGQIIS